MHPCGWSRRKNCIEGHGHANPDTCANHVPHEVFPRRGSKPNGIENFFRISRPKGKRCAQDDAMFATVEYQSGQTISGCGQGRRHREVFGFVGAEKRIHGWISPNG